MDLIGGKFHVDLISLHSSPGTGHFPVRQVGSGEGPTQHTLFRLLHVACRHYDVTLIAKEHLGGQQQVWKKQTAIWYMFELNITTSARGGLVVIYSDFQS